MAPTFFASRNTYEAISNARAQMPSVGDGRKGADRSTFGWGAGAVLLLGGTVLLLAGTVLRLGGTVLLFGRAGPFYLLLAGAVLLLSGAWGRSTFGWGRSTFGWGRSTFGLDRSTFGWGHSTFGWVLGPFFVGGLFGASGAFRGLWGARGGPLGLERGRGFGPFFFVVAANHPMSPVVASRQGPDAHPHRPIAVVVVVVGIIVQPVQPGHLAIWHET